MNNDVKYTPRGPIALDPIPPVFPEVTAEGDTSKKLSSRLVTTSDIHGNAWYSSDAMPELWLPLSFFLGTPGGWSNQTPVHQFRPAARTEKHQFLQRNIGERIQARGPSAFNASTPFGALAVQLGIDTVTITEKEVVFSGGELFLVVVPTYLQNPGHYQQPMVLDPSPKAKAPVLLPMNEIAMEWVLKFHQ